VIEHVVIEGLTQKRCSILGVKKGLLDKSKFVYAGKCNSTDVTPNKSQKGVVTCNCKVKKPQS